MILPAVQWRQSDTGTDPGVQYSDDSRSKQQHPSLVNTNLPNPDWSVCLIPAVVDGWFGVSIKVHQRYSALITRHLVVQCVGQQIIRTTWFAAVCLCACYSLVSLVSGDGVPTTVL